jgi:hypothetical protein
MECVRFSAALDYAAHREIQACDKGPTQSADESGALHAFRVVWSRRNIPRDGISTARRKRRSSAVSTGASALRHKKKRLAREAPAAVSDQLVRISIPVML